MSRRVWSGIVAALMALAGPGPWPVSTGQAQPDCRVPQFAYKHGVVVFTEHGRAAPVRVEVADTEPAREVGLMCRTSLDPDAGMLFVFEESTDVPFWMKDTLIPLSIAFLDAAWHIVALLDMKVAPDPDKGPFEYYAPGRAYRYALEVNQGFFQQHGIDEKAEVRFLLRPATGPTPGSSAPAP